MQSPRFPLLAVRTALRGFSGSAGARVAAVVVLVLSFAWPAHPGSAGTGSCDARAVAGAYASNHGPVTCDATADGVACCYGAGCRNKLDLTFTADRSALSGAWSYPDGTRGPAEFTLGADCALARGRWGRAGRPPTAPWVMRRRADDRPASAENRPRALDGALAESNGPARPQAAARRDAPVPPQPPERSAAPAPPPPASADIVVRGRYSCRLGEVGAQVSLDRGEGDAVTGAIAVFALDPATTPGAARGVTASQYRVSGSLDRLTGAVDLRAGEWIGARGPGRPSGIRGVYLDRDGLLLGRLMLEARADPQCSMLIASREENRYRLPAPAGTAGAPEPLTCELLADWARRLTREYPGLDVPNTELSLLSERAIPLFYDDAFTAAFGTGFDEVLPDRRQAIFDKITECKRDRSLRPILVGIPTRPFTLPRGLDGSDATEALVWRSRALARWRAGILASVQQLPASRESFGRVRTMVHSVDDAMDREWPSTRAAFKEAMAGTLAAIADRVFQSELDAHAKAPPSLATARAVLDLLQGREESRPDVIASAPMSPAAVRAYRERARALQRAGNVDHGPGLVSALSAESRRRVQERGRDVLDKILEAATGADAVAIDAFPDGLQGLEASHTWWLGMAARYQPFGTSPPILALRARLEARRAALLRQAAPALVSRIEAARSYRDVEAVLARALLFDTERASPAGQRLAAAAETRRAAIDRETYLAMFSPRERSLMGEGDRLVVPTRHDPPTGEEIRLATLREIANLWGTLTGPRTATVGTGPFSAFIRFDLTLADATNISCAPAGAAFRCRYTIKPTLALSGSATRDVGRDLRAGFLGFLLSMANAGEPATLTDEFVLTARGWSSATIRTRYVEGLWRGISAMAEGLARGAAGEACFAKAMTDDFDPECY